MKGRNPKLADRTLTSNARPFQWEWDRARISQSAGWRRYGQVVRETQGRLWGVIASIEVLRARRPSFCNPEGFYAINRDL
jgi:hypothetical protein